MGPSFCNSAHYSWTGSQNTQGSISKILSTCFCTCKITSQQINADQLNKSVGPTEIRYNIQHLIILFKSINHVYSIQKEENTIFRHHHRPNRSHYGSIINDGVTPLTFPIDLNKQSLDDVRGYACRLVIDTNTPPLIKKKETIFSRQLQRNKGRRTTNRSLSIVSTLSSPPPLLTV